MALFKFKTPEINFRNFLKNNWKSAAAIGLTVAGAVGVGLLCAFFPPAIPFIAGITVFGVAPFAGLASMSVVAASFAAAGIAAAAVVGFSAIVNAVTKISNLLDNLFRSKKTHVTDFKHEEIVTTASPFNNPALKRNSHGHDSNAANNSTLGEEEPLIRKGGRPVEITPPTTAPITKVEDLGTTNKRYGFLQETPVDAKVLTDTNVEVTSHESLVVNGPK
ncbi:Uncharacterised protein [Legionella busanensis]|uniref:Transmembrane protein n=1 Tax=Legionella busanensis TaxID=190655 RepID=A0A378JNE4_9GAMM|nr:hypothetical protein [Legionella busanensis]STX52896.1 Uncharacterised protein [Legionella busanensis]